MACFFVAQPLFVNCCVVACSSPNGYVNASSQCAPCTAGMLLSVVCLVVRMCFAAFIHLFMSLISREQAPRTLRLWRNSSSTLAISPRVCAPVATKRHRTTSTALVCLFLLRYIFVFSFRCRIDFLGWLSFSSKSAQLANGRPLTYLPLATTAALVSVSHCACSWSSRRCTIIMFWAGYGSYPGEVFNNSHCNGLCPPVCSLLSCVRCSRARSVVAQGYYCPAGVQLPCPAGALTRPCLCLYSNHWFDSRRYLSERPRRNRATVCWRSLPALSDRRLLSTRQRQPD